jgi:2-hydroxychromene-2-carboxylate isomerase
MATNHLSSQNADTIEFWFDLGSPYAYIAHRRMAEIREQTGRPVLWRVFMLGIAFKATGSAPLLDIPLKATYARHDLKRLADYYAIPFQLPPGAPTNTLTAARAFMAIARTSTDAAERFAATCFDAAFASGRDLADAAVLGQCLAESGNSQTVLEDTKDPAVKTALIDSGDEALAKGVFGSPFFFYREEPFWGTDRIDMLIARATGNWPRSS